MIDFSKTFWQPFIDSLSTIYVGFSGGLDSTVLLEGLISAGVDKRIVAIHINHGIHPDAFTWQQHCEDFCRHYGISLIIHTLETRPTANIEQKLRQSRYQKFAESITVNEAGLLLAHHQTDQIETFLLQLLRGTGNYGLAAMPTKRVQGNFLIIRPLLGFSRAELEKHAKQKMLNWVEDSSNQDKYFTRNYIRHELMPNLKQRFPQIDKALQQAINQQQQTLSSLEALAKIDYPEDLSTQILNTSLIQSLDYPRINNILRLWFRNNHIAMVNATLLKQLHQAIKVKSTAYLTFFWKNISLRCYQGNLYIVTPTLKLSSKAWINFPKPLYITGNFVIKALPAEKGIKITDCQKLTIAFRQEKSQIKWHGHQKSLKKLFQQWRILPWQRDNQPLLYCNQQLISVINYAIHDDYYDEKGNNWQIIYEIE